ncbi:MAG: hypothetical protein R3B84_08195 [Zavarzinella sp.]
MKLCMYSLVLLAGTTQLASAADFAGNWRLSVPIQGQRESFDLNMLFMFSEVDGKWIADFLDTVPVIKIEAKTSIVIREQQISLDITFGPNRWKFEGKMADDGKMIKGTLDQDGSLILLDLKPTKLKSLSKDLFQFQKELLDSSATDQEFFGNLFLVLDGAEKNKMTEADVRAYVEKAMKRAEAYGTKWQETISLRIAERLIGQQAFIAIAVEQAKLPERLLTRDDTLLKQLTTLERIAQIFENKRDAEFKEYMAKVARLEPRVYADYLRNQFPFQPEAYAGRKAASNRVAVVELFTGSESEGSVGVDLAVTGLLQSYKPTELLVLSYHVNIPGPDPLANAETDERLNFYIIDQEKQNTPAIFINGKEELSGGGSAKLARAKYAAYKELIDPWLEKPAEAKLAVAATGKGDDITIKVNYADIAKPGEKIILRFVVTEERVRFKAGNGQIYHHAVVRATPGGTKGFPLTEKTGEKSLAIKVSELKANQIKAMDNLEARALRAGVNFKFSSRPLDFKNLQVVALIQNDETKEIIQAAAVALPE